MVAKERSLSPTPLLYSTGPEVKKVDFNSVTLDTSPAFHALFSSKGDSNSIYSWGRDSLSLSTFGQDQAQPRRLIQKWQLKLTLEKNEAVCSGFRDSNGIRVGFAEEAELRMKSGVLGCHYGNQWVSGPRECPWRGVQEAKGCWGLRGQARAVMTKVGASSPEGEVAPGWGRAVPLVESEGLEPDRCLSSCPSSAAC